jgi:hypothetical protein
MIKVIGGAFWLGLGVLMIGVLSALVAIVWIVDKGLHVVSSAINSLFDGIYKDL